MTLALLTALLVAQPGPVGLTLALSVKVPAEKERQALELIAKELLRTGLVIGRFDQACAGEPACLADAAKGKGLPIFISVTLGASAREVLVDLEAVRSDDRASLGQVTFSTTLKLEPQSRQRLEQFAATVRAGLAAIKPPGPAPSPPVAAADTPVPAKLLPEPTPPPPAVVEEAPPEGRSKVPGVLLGAGAAVAAGVSVGFGVLGMTQQQRANASLDGVHSTLLERDARALVNDANANYSGSLAAGIAAGALATGLLIWLLNG